MLIFGGKFKYGKNSELFNWNFYDEGSFVGPGTPLLLLFGYLVGKVGIGIVDFICSEFFFKVSKSFSCFPSFSDAV